MGEVLLLRNSHFFDQSCFWNDLLMISEGFRDHFGSQHGTEMASEIDQKNNGFLDRPWKGFGPPREAWARLRGEGRGPRRGVGER